MTWTRLGDDFTDRPATLGVSRSARLLNIEGLVWCNRHTTNGALPVGAVPRLTDSPDPAADVIELVAAGVWEPTETGWQLDWSEQDAAEDVRQRQEIRNERQRRYRRRKMLHDSGDHSACDSKFCKSVTRNDDRNGDGNDARHVTPSLPVPSRRDRDRGSGPAAQARRPAHQWQDDGSDISCLHCGLNRDNAAHELAGAS